MLEIIALYFFCKKMGALLRSKGWSKPVWMQILLVLVWFACEFLASLVFALIVAVTKGPAAAEQIGLTAYLIAVPAAVIGVGVLFLIANMLPNREPVIPPLPRSNAE